MSLLPGHKLFEFSLHLKHRHSFALTYLRIRHIDRNHPLENDVKFVSLLSILNDIFQRRKSFNFEKRRYLPQPVLAKLGQLSEKFDFFDQAL